jgi:hypothetical protein
VVPFLVIEDELDKISSPGPFCMFDEPSIARKKRPFLGTVAIESFNDLMSPNTCPCGTQSLEGGFKLRLHSTNSAPRG